MPQAPSYLIIGSMKCGTTALQEFMCLHPRICPPKQKEIHYFSLYYYKGVDWYRSFFTNEGDLISGEASPSYFDVTNTGLIPRVIKEFDKEIKLILILRDPVLRAISHFHHLKLVSKIPELSEMTAEDFFSGSLDMIWSEASIVNHYAKQCLDFSLYLPKYYLFREIFQENMIVLRNEDLLENPEMVMSRVFSYLGVDSFTDPYFNSFIFSANTKREDISRSTYLKLSRLLSPGWIRLQMHEGYEPSIAGIQ